MSRRVLATRTVQKAAMLLRLPAIFLVITFLAACAAAPTTPREEVPERPDPRITPLTLEQHRQIAEE